MENEIFLNDIIKPKNIQEIVSNFTARKFSVKIEDEETVLGTKTTIRGYKILITISKKPGLTGTDMWRVTSTSRGAEKEFQKLVKLFK